MRRLLQILGCLGALPVVVGFAAVGHAQLATQTVKGTVRTCLYRNQTASRVVRPYVAAQVARGEPCPSTPPSPKSITTAPPSGAMLVRQSRDIGKVVCSYAYLGQIYIVELAPGLRCTLTPSSQR